MGHGPYVKLVTSFLFTSLAFMVRTAPLSLIRVLPVTAQFGPLKPFFLFFLASPVAPGGKLCPVLHLHSGLQERLPKHPAGHHGE